MKSEFNARTSQQSILKSFAYENNRWTLPQNTSCDVDNVYRHIIVQCESEDYHTHQRANIHSYRRPPVNSYFLRYFAIFASIKQIDKKLDPVQFDKIFSANLSLGFVTLI